MALFPWFIYHDWFFNGIVSINCKFFLLTLFDENIIWKYSFKRVSDEPLAIHKLRAMQFPMSMCPTKPMPTSTILRIKPIRRCCSFQLVNDNPYSPLMKTIWGRSWFSVGWLGSSYKYQQHIYVLLMSHS